MKSILVRGLQLFSYAAVISAPIIVFAQSISNVQNLFALFLNILNGYVVPIIFALAFVMFLFGIYTYFIAGGAEEEKTKQGRQFLLWSIIGFVLMFSIWGIINLFVNSFGFQTASQPAFPTFSTYGISTSSSNPFGALLNSTGLGSILGGGSTSYTNGSTAGSATLVPGQSFTDPITNQVFTATSANTYQPVNGSCGSSGTLNGSTCRLNTASSENGSGSVQPGGACKTNGDCADANGTSYGCYQGTCTVNGDAPADGTVQPGGACTNNNSCADQNGLDFTCQNGICTNNASANSTIVSCSDGSVADSCTDCPTGICSTNSGSGNGGPTDACPYGTDSSGNCLPASSASTATVVCPDDGVSVPASIGCTTCSDGSQASSDANCPVGTPTSGSASSNGTISCPAGYTEDYMGQCDPNSDVQTTGGTTGNTCYDDSGNAYSC